MKAILYPTRAGNVSVPSRREQVLKLMWAGKGMKEIAAELGLSPKTVEGHRANLYRVFRVNDPVSLCRKAVAAGVMRSSGDSKEVAV